jgi:uncharacterized protein (DUF1778 family)
MYGRSKKINLRLGRELLEAIDEAAAANYQTRSDYMRESIVLRLNRQVVMDQPDPDQQWQAALDDLLKSP